MSGMNMDTEAIQLKLVVPNRKFRHYPVIGFLLGGMAGLIAFHPLSMLVRAAHETIYFGKELVIGRALISSFQFFMWPMLLLNTLLGMGVGLILGFILMRLKQNRARLDLLNQEFQLQVAALRHHYKSLVIGISGFSSRIKQRIERLEKKFREASPQGTTNEDLVMEIQGLASNVDILERTSLRLASTLHQELSFLKALSSDFQNLEKHDLQPLLLHSIRELLDIRYPEKPIEIEVNGQSPDHCSGSWVFPFEPYAVEVILQNILNNALKLSDQIRVTIREEDPWFQVTVQDSGPGLDIGKLQNALMSPLEKKDSASTHLGLKVSLHLLDRMGGDSGF